MLLLLSRAGIALQKKNAGGLVPFTIPPASAAYASRRLSLDTAIRVQVAKTIVDESARIVNALTRE
jgi:hypothetical protein